MGSEVTLELAFIIKLWRPNRFSVHNGYSWENHILAKVLHAMAYQWFLNLSVYQAQLPGPRTHFLTQQVLEGASDLHC